MTPLLPSFDDYRAHLAALRAAALAAVDPAQAVRRWLTADDLVGVEQVYLVALGKAAAGMALAAADVLGPRLTAGVAAVPRLPEAGHGRLPERVTFIEGGHPEPTSGSLTAGRAVEALLSQVTAHDLVLVLVSGGGSAMLELPRAGLTLAELKGTTAALLRSGAPIHDFNAVRTQLSQLKGGGLARLAHPARVLGLILSDVVGSPLSAIAAGPTVLDAADSGGGAGGGGAFWPAAPAAGRGAARAAARHRPAGGRAAAGGEPADRLEPAGGRGGGGRRAAAGVCRRADCR